MLLYFDNTTILHMNLYYCTFIIHIVTKTPNQSLGTETLEHLIHTLQIHRTTEDWYYKESIEGAMAY